MFVRYFGCFLLALPYVCKLKENFRRVAMVKWLRQKTHDRKVLGSNPHSGDHFSGTIHLDQSLEQKLWKTLTWHCCMCCNPANGRVDFVELSAYKTQATWYWMNCKLVSPLRPKSKKKKKLDSNFIYSSSKSIFAQWYLVNFVIYFIIFQGTEKDDPVLGQAL